jgi:hypothetical protein
MMMEEVHEQLGQLMKGSVPWWDPWSGDPHKYTAGMIANWARFLERDIKRNTWLVGKYAGADVIALLNQALEAHARSETFPPEPDQSKFCDLDEPGEETQLDDPDFSERCPRCGAVSRAREVGEDRVFGYCVRHRLKWRALQQTLDLDQALSQPVSADFFSHRQRCADQRVEAIRAVRGCRVRGMGRRSETRPRNCARGTTSRISLRSGSKGGLGACRG